MHVTTANAYLPNTVRLKRFAFDAASFEPVQIYIPPSRGCTFEISRILSSFDRIMLVAVL
jgi:hypothetical protein